MDNDAAYCAAMEERFSRAVGAGEMSAAEARRRVGGMRGLDPQPPDVDRLRSGVTADPALSLLLLREDLVTMMGELNAWVEHEFGQRDDRLAKLEELVDRPSGVGVIVYGGSHRVDDDEVEFVFEDEVRHPLLVRPH